MVDVLILQHPLEATHAKGSARLLHLSLPHSRLVVGERFPEPELSALLHAPLRASDTTARTPLLLYPDQPADGAATRSPLLDSGLPQQLRLVVLDGTWRKSSKMLHLNPMLQQLPRLSLRDLPPSAYAIRKARDPHQLSTLEAACRALMLLENNPDRYRPLLAAFDGFVAQQAQYVKS